MNHYLKCWGQDKSLCEHWTGHEFLTSRPLPPPPSDMYDRRLSAFHLFLLLFYSLLLISCSSNCENKQSSRSNYHSHKGADSLWHCSCLLSLLSMSSLTTSSHTETYFRTTVSCQHPLCLLPTFHPDFDLFYFPSDMPPEELRVRYVSEVNMVRLRGSGQLKAKGFIGLDNPALMWLNEALHYTVHGLMLHIRLP